MAVLTRKFTSRMALPQFELPMCEDKGWVPFGRDDVAKADGTISRKHLEFGYRSAGNDGASDAQLFLVRRLSGNPSFVCRERAGEPAEEWHLVPCVDASHPKQCEPFRLAHGDRLYVCGLLAAGADATDVAPLANEPGSVKRGSVKYEYLVEISAGASAAEAPAHDDAPTLSPHAAAAGAAESAAGAPATLERALADLELIPDEPGFNTYECGLRALDRACEAGRALDRRVAELREEERARGALLAAAQDELLKACADLREREAALFANAVPILSAKERKLAHLG